MLLRNEASGNHWVTVALEGTKSNRSAIGAKVTIEVAGRRQIAEVRSGGSYISQNDLRVHFGLGASSVIDRLEIRWPSGSLDTAMRVAADRTYHAREGAALKPR
jgi:hypothetical protein